MTLPTITYSDDQAEAFDRVTEVLRDAGVDLENSVLTPLSDGKQKALAVIGKAGSGN